MKPGTIILLVVLFLAYEHAVARSGIRTRSQFVGDAGRAGINAPTRFNADDARFAAAARSGEMHESDPDPSRALVDRRANYSSLKDGPGETLRLAKVFDPEDPALHSEIELFY
jgi:hypothetical protein